MSALFSTLNGEQMHRLPPVVTVCSYRKEHIDDELYMRFRINKDSTTAVYCIETTKRTKVRMYFLISVYFWIL